IDVKTSFAYKFIYKTKLDKELTEHEYDHVFVGVYDGKPAVNAEEVEDWKYVDVDALKKDITDHPDKYTSWFKLIMSHPELNKQLSKVDY
ncbi:NUDIX domain-containing protein, partial [Fulvivirgaceae bacterium PWU5]